MDKIHRMVTSRTAAERLGIKLATFHKLVRAGELPPNLPGTRVWDWEEITAWRERRISDRAGDGVANKATTT